MVTSAEQCALRGVTATVGPVCRYRHARFHLSQVHGSPRNRQVLEVHREDGRVCRMVECSRARSAQGGPPVMMSWCKPAQRDTQPVYD